MQTLGLIFGIKQYLGLAIGTSKEFGLSQQLD